VRDEPGRVDLVSMAERIICSDIPFRTAIVRRPAQSPKAMAASRIPLRFLLRQMFRHAINQITVSGAPLYARLSAATGSSAAMRIAG
jgi:hypothetical protein